MLGQYSCLAGLSNIAQDCQYYPEPSRSSLLPQRTSLLNNVQSKFMEASGKHIWHLEETPRWLVGICNLFALFEKVTWKTGERASLRISFASVDNSQHRV